MNKVSVVGDEGGDEPYVLYTYLPEERSHYR